MARPTKLTDKIRDEICTRLASGESLRSICKDSHIPAVSTVLLWVVTNRDGFSEHYARAREAQGHYHVDEMLDMRFGVLDGSIDAQSAKVVADMIKWSAERMARKSFGKSDNEPPKDDKPITINIVDAVKQANDND